MTPHTGSAPGALTRFLERIGNPLEWDAVEKVRIILAIVVPATCGALLRAIYLIDHPEAEPYVSRAALEHIVKVATGYVIFAAILIAVGFRLGRTNRGARVYAYIANLSWWLLFAWVAYLLGLATTPLWVVYIMLGFMCLLLFELPVAVTGIATSLGIIVAMTIAERLGLVGYAPYFAEWPEVNGRLATAWIISGITWPASVSIVTFVVFAVILRQARRQSEQLAVAGEQLTRANELISRYVAAQVAEQIMAGNPEAIERTERRKLTIFFSDIRGFTEIAERLEPEELAHMLNEYLTEMTAIATKHGGMIDKFVGDAIMVLFGAPAATSDRDHALRAVHMAIEMQSRMRTLQEKWRSDAIEETLEVRMGINTGLASVGNFGSEGRMDYTAIGRQVNLAARLQAACEPGRILVSHRTWMLVHDEIPCESKGEIQIRGVRDPVRVYEVALRG